MLIFDDYADVKCSDSYGYDDEQYNVAYGTSIPKNPTSPLHVHVLTRNGSSHWIDCDGDPYDYDFERD